MAIAEPDLSSRPVQCFVERVMISSPRALFLAWTEQFDRWFAAPGTVLMRPEVDAPFFFETHYQGNRHPHYGRFLAIDPDKLVKLTWVTGADGTEGAETIVTVEFTPKDSGTLVRLSHAGFPNMESMKRHESAWVAVLANQDRALSGGA